MYFIGFLIQGQADGGFKFYKNSDIIYKYDR